MKNHGQPFHFRYFKEPGGLSLGPGGFVSALEYAADCQAEVVGKPQSSFFLSALGSSKPEEAIMIGDVSCTSFPYYYLHTFNQVRTHFRRKQ